MSPSSGLVAFATALLVVCLTPRPAPAQDSITRPQNESAARKLESLIAARGPEAALAEYRKTIAGNERYSVVEKEFNALGSHYLQTNKPQQAVVVFEINAEAFPQSWNAWDGLGDGYFFASYGAPSNEARAALRDKSEACYTRSLALNPKNENGRMRLSEMRGPALDAARETKEALRFAPGATTGLTGPYLGQRPPGATAEVFAPGIVSTAGHFDFAITFTPDGKEIYFTRQKEGRNTLMVARLEKDGWTAPAPAAFAKGFSSNEPHVTPDGRKLYFGSERPQPGATQASYGIWVVERTAAGTWSEPRYHGPGMYVSAARNGNLYMSDLSNATGAGGGGAIVYPWRDGRYGPPQLLGGGVNAPRAANHSFIAPDESYILIDSTRPGGQGGDGDLYVCFRKPDGTWSDAVNLGDAVNTDGTTFCPSVSPDGQYIFYAASRDIYWVSAKILDQLKVKALGAAPTPDSLGWPVPGEGHFGGGRRSDHR